MDKTTDTPATPARVLYAQPDILSRGKFSKSHLYNLMARGHFPQPVLRMGPRFTRWGSDVDQWFADPAAWIATNANTVEA
jgi:predicted DNA-binding transcriptional regulator AlpA